MKPTRLLIPVAAALCLPSCQGPIRNLRRYGVAHEECRAFVVVRQNRHYPIGFIDRENNLTLIRADLDTLGQIENLWFSPSGRKVIIESCGEGHQYLTVYRVSDLIDGGDRSEMIPPVGALGPYPSAFRDIRWVDDDKIRFCYRADFSAFDPDLRRGKYRHGIDEDPERTRRWDIHADTFAEIDAP